MASIWDDLGTQTPNPEAGSKQGPALEQSGSIWDLPSPDAVSATPQKRGILGAANDTVITAANAALGGVQAASDFISPGNQFSQSIEEIIKEGEAKQSDVTKAGRAKLGQAMESEDIGTQLKGVKEFVTQNPLQAAAMAAGSFALPGGAIKGAKLVSGALGLGSKAAGRTALGAGMATSGVLAGGDAAGDAYQQVMNAPSLASMPISEREQLATDAARKASVVPFVIGAAGGAFGAEKALATGTKSLLKTGAQEFVSEAVEEGGTKLSANVAAQQKAPEISTWRGVAGSAALGGVLGGGTGLAVGAVTRQPDSLLAGSTNISSGEGNPEADAINKAIDANSSEIDTDTNVQVEEIRQQQVQLDQARAQAQQEAETVAAQQAQEQAAVQQQQAQEAFVQVAQTYGVQPLEAANQFQVGGKRFFSIPQVNAFLQEIDKLNEGRPEEQKALLGAALASGAVKVQQTANAKTINNAAIKFLDGYGFGDAETKIEAADRANTIINSLEGPKALKEAEQLNSFVKTITGTDAPAFVSLQEAVNAAPKLTKGASNEQLQQLQTNARIREVPVQGGATQTSGTGIGDVRPTGVQPIGTASIGAGSPSVQAGVIPSSGVPTSTSADGSRVSVPSDGTQAQEEVSSPREDALRVVNQVITRAFGERDAKIVLEVLTKEKTQSQIAKEFGISDARVNQIAGPQAQETWGSRILLAARNMGISKAEMGSFLEIMSTEETIAEDQVVNEDILNEVATEATSAQNVDDTNIATSDEDLRLGTEEVSTGEEGGPSGFRVFNPDVSGQTELEDASANNRTRRKLKTTELEKLKDFELNNLAADENTTVEELDQIVDELLRRQDVRVAKGDENAVQKRSTEKVSVRKQSETGKRVPSKDTEGGKAATEGKAAKEISSLTVEEYFDAKADINAKLDALTLENEKLTETQNSLTTKGIVEGDKYKYETEIDTAKAKYEKNDKEIDALIKQLQDLKLPKKAKTAEEQAAQAWNDAAKEFPDAPKFADLTKEQQDDWVSFGEENWTADDVQTELVKLAKKYSVAKPAPKGSWSAEKLKANLKETFNTTEAFDELVKVVDSIESLPENIQQSIKADIGEDAQTSGFVEGDKVYLIANNIKQGEELAVLLHELGAHIGMVNLVGEYNYNKLIDKVQNWATGKGSALEVSIAKKAGERLAEHQKAMKLSAAESRDEMLAYFVEEAILAGVNPTATEVKGSGQIIQFLRSLVANMKVALRKIGFNNFDKLTAADIVNLSFGAAKLELDGTYHGTRTEFRKFLDEKITTVLSGWGVYTTNLKQESKTYGEKTIRALPLVDRKDLIQNDRPLEDQPAVVKKLRAVPSKEFQDFLDEIGLLKLDGGDLQGALGNWEVTSEGGVYRLLSKAAQDAAVDVKEIVSLFLDEQGIPGSTFKPYGRGMPNRQTIIFKAKNINRVAQETAKGMKFSLKKARETTEKQMAKLPEPVRTPLQHMMDNIYDFAKKGLPYFAFTEDLADIAAKYIPSAKKYVGLIKERQAIRTKFERNVDQILQQYDKLPTEVKGTGEKSVNQFLKDATMSGKWAYNPGWIKGFKEETDIDPDAKDRFEAMPAAARELIKSVFAHGHSSLLAMQKAVTENINTEYDALIAEANRTGDVQEASDLTKKKAATLTEYTTLMRTNSKKPYAPLKRFGNYVVVGKSQQYIDNEIMANSKTAAPDVVAEARKKLRELEKNENHYFVQFAETAGEAKAIVRDEAGNFDYLENFEKDSSQGYGVRDLNDVFNRLRNMVQEGTDSNLTDTSQKVMNRLMADLKLTLLSESSARQSERRRKNIAGAENDMMRAFATQGRATANFIASMENSESIYNTLREMKDETDSYKGEGTRAERRRYYNEFMKRHFMGMDYQPSPFIDKALSTTSMWMLLTNPSYYLQNMTQPFMMSLPVMAGKHGYARSWKEMTRAYTDIASVIKESGLGEESYAKLPADVRKVVEELVNRGRIDISLEQDLGRWRSSEDAKLAKFGRASELLRGMAQDIETINRVATAVAAYRLEVRRSNPTNATNYADKIIYTTHGDYSGTNAPRIARSGLGRVATQFRKFQLIQISLMARLYNDAFKNEDADVRLAGKYSLAFTVGHTAVMGGIMGLPGFAVLAMLYGMAFGDDDEPNNPELALRKAIGDDTIADFLVKGVPAGFGLDVSGKLGMGQMLSVLPYTDITLSKKGVYEAIGTLLTGPFGGLLSKSAEGLGYIGRGDYYKGVEQMVPTGLSNVMKGYRFGTEGITNRAGDVTMSPDDIGTIDAFMVALGLPTKVINDRNFLNAAKFDFDQFYNDKASEIKREYVRAYNEGDTEARTQSREDWKKLQESRARNGYTKQPLSTLLKAPREKVKREKNTVGGVAVNKANRGFVKQTSEQ